METLMTNDQKPKAERIEYAFKEVTDAIYTWGNTAPGIEAGKAFNIIRNAIEKYGDICAKSTMNQPAAPAVREALEDLWNAYLSIKEAHALIGDESLEDKVEEALNDQDGGNG